MSENALKLTWIDARKDDVRKQINALRQKLSLKGNIVSEAGKRRTIEIFGAPLTPAEVVNKICFDVASKGLSALLDYSLRIDRANLTADELRVPDADFDEALKSVEPEYLASVDRIRENIETFQCRLLKGPTEPAHRSTVLGL